MQTFKLENITVRAKTLNPRKFIVPTETELDNLKAGEMVRLFFVLNFETDDNCRAERMWVEITEIEGENFKGVLTNMPVYIKDIKQGDVIEFTRENIATVVVKAKFNEKTCALITKRAIEKGEVNYLYRDEPENPKDSGWCLFYGDEDENYNDNAENITIAPLDYVLSFEPRLEEVFCLKHGAFEWNQELMKFTEVND